MSLSFKERNLLRRGIRLDHQSGGMPIGREPSNGGLNSNIDRPLSAEQYDARDVIDEALQSQLDLMASGRFDAFKGKGGADFLEAFLHDPFFAQFYQVAQSAISKIVSPRYYKIGFRGAMFEEMGFLYESAVAAADPSKPIPLSPDDAFNILHALHPNAEVTEHPFNKKSLKRIYVPDGFGVNKNGKVIQFIEYASSDKGDKFEMQEKAFWMEVWALGSLASAPVFLKVTPRGLPVPGDNNKVPINDVVLRGTFCPYVYSQYRVEEGAPTLAELRREWHESPAGQQAAAGEPALFRK